MKKFLIAASLFLGTLPVHASQFDMSHNNAIQVLRDNYGVVTEINPDDPDCLLLYGWYWEKDGKPTIGICTKDNFGPEDRDTLRHEIYHYFQDCSDGKVDYNFSFTYNDRKYDEIITFDYGVEKTFDVYQNYSTSEDAKQIRLEVEAFHAAEHYSISQILDKVTKVCKPINQN